MKRLFCLLFCLSLLGCQQENDQKPANMIPEAQMVQVLADIHTAEAQIEGKVIYPDTALMTFNYAQQQLLKRHGVTEQQFRDTYGYYLHHLQEMDQLYETVLDTLIMRESKAKAAEGIEENDEAAPEDLGPMPHGRPIPMQ